jgi:ribosomal protein L37AE/L43A
MNAELCFNCDNCGKAGIIISKSGIMYCKFCHYSYGESIYEKLKNE